MNDQLTRFSDRVDNYVKYRPTYPPSIIAFLESEMGLVTEHTVADIGAGTGISADMFLKNGNTVFAVEPNAQMRKAAEKLFEANLKFQAFDGTAEHTGLKNQSVEWIVAAQAFHWFDPTRAKEEFQRVLKARGTVLLLWNDRLLEGTPFLKEYEELLLEFGTDYQKVRHNNFSESTLREFLGSDFGKKNFSNSQRFDYEGLLGRLLSSSYAPNRNHPRFIPMEKCLQEIFERNKSNETVEIIYDTRLFYGRL